MNETRDIKSIEQIYGLITENEDNRVWKNGDCPEALGDSEFAHKHPEGQGSLGVHDREDLAAGFGAPITPEDGKDNAYYMKKISERLKEKGKKAGKSVNEEINNFETMSDNNPENIFDKLYSTIMEGDDPFADLDAGLPGEEGEDMGDDELGLDDGGDEVTLNLPRDLAEQLMDALQGQLDGGDEEGDDFGDEGGEDSFEDEMLGDAVVSEPAPKPLGGHGDRQHKDAGNTGSGSNKIKNTSKAIGD